MKKAFISLLIIIVFMGCANSIRSIKGEYNFSIDYDYNQNLALDTEKYRKKFSSDKLYLFVEDEFVNDTLYVFVNGSKYIEQQLNTDQSTGLSSEIKIPDFKKINTIGIGINDSPVVSFEVFNKEINMIGINKKGINVGIMFYKQVPIYD
jgi:hypothetical protein